jgi:hypothetical protein
MSFQKVQVSQIRAKSSFWVWCEPCDKFVKIAYREKSDTHIRHYCPYDTEEN